MNIFIFKREVNMNIFDIEIFEYEYTVKPLYSLLVYFGYLIREGAFQLRGLELDLKNPPERIGSETSKKVYWVRNVRVDYIKLSRDRRKVLYKGIIFIKGSKKFEKFFH
jgi:hypothetical protein